MLGHRIAFTLDKDRRVEQSMDIDGKKNSGSLLSAHVRLYLSIITVPKSSVTVVTVRIPMIPATLEDPLGKKML